MFIIAITAGHGSERSWSESAGIKTYTKIRGRVGFLLDRRGSRRCNKRKWNVKEPNERWEEKSRHWKGKKLGEVVSRGGSRFLIRPSELWKLHKTSHKVEGVAREMGFVGLLWSERGVLCGGRGGKVSQTLRCDTAKVNYHLRAFDIHSLCIVQYFSFQFECLPFS